MRCAGFVLIPDAKGTVKIYAWIYMMLNAKGWDVTLDMKVMKLLSLVEDDGSEY